ncbi:MAG TPA: serine/threonine-protein kinase, partial [Polyangiaceae bacterium]|nr:serine/threonine-protein kinase [Polyangiaceae bacterium]
MTPCPSENDIVDFVEGRLDEGARAGLHDHIAECSACRETLANLAPPEGEPAAHGPAPSAAPAPAAGEAGRPPPAFAPAPGEVVGGRYRLERLLGSGGMGAVWAATHLVTRRAVALKMLRALDGARPEERRRLLREAQAASAVEHPNVVRVLDAFEADGAPALVMDLLTGESLAQRLAREGRLSLGEAAVVLRPVVAAVAAAHRAGVVHRDLKPANVFLAAGSGGGPDVRVLDFGVAKLLERPGGDAHSGSLTRTGEVVGTPFYMSPEQFYGEPDVDPRADVWALGVVLYECLAGRRPF